MKDTDCHWHFWRNAAVFATMALALACPTAMSAPIPWDKSKPMAPIVARDMPLHEFLQSIFADQGLQAMVSPAVAQKPVNGRYQGNPSQVFDRLVRTYSLLPYFEGSTVYVFSASEAQSRSRSLSQASAARVIDTLNQLRLHDGKYNTFVSVPASGLLQIRGAPPFVEQVEEVITSVQRSAAADPQEISVFPLKHAWAWDVTLSSGGRQIVVPGVATTLRNLLSSLAPVKAVTNPRVSVGKLRGKGLAGGNETDALARSGDASSEHLGSEGNLPGVASVVAEVRTNSVVVRDSSDRKSIYADLIRALDVEPTMIELETTIIDVKSDRIDELGVNWRFSNSNSEIRLGQGNSSDTNLANTLPGLITPFGRGLTWSTILDRNRLVARITALAATGDARVVSRSQVATLANLESVIEANQTFYVKVGGFQEVDLFPVTAGTSVRITPRISDTVSRKMVSMVVSIRDGKLAESVADQIPSVKEVSLNTHGIVPEDQTFVIGGFKQESSGNREEKVPLLGDLPVLGAAFRSTSRLVDNTERLFLITPRIRSVEQLASINDTAASPPTSVPTVNSGSAKQPPPEQDAGYVHPPHPEGS